MEVTLRRLTWMVTTRSVLTTECPLGQRRLSGLRSPSMILLMITMMIILVSFTNLLQPSSSNFISDSEELTEMKGRNEDTETMFDMKSDQIKNFIHTIRLNLGKVKHFQFMQGADMSRDTHNVMRMTERLDTWSLIHLSIMLVIGISQVVFLQFRKKFSLRITII